MGRYDDIIGLPHHQSQTRPRMSMRDRAGQFSPYAALVGYGDAVEETGRYTARRRELCEDEKERLDRHLRWLIAHISENPMVEITWFVNDPRKEGGEYVTAAGRAERFDREQCLLWLDTGEKADLTQTVEIREIG